jgi:hypothetical protein
MKTHASNLSWSIYAAAAAIVLMLLIILPVAK